MGTTYADVIRSLFVLQKHGIKLGLETIRELLRRLGNPEQQFPVLHVGGTNGKGSTAAILASILQRSGCRVGLYTSPHLVDFRERIRIQGEHISEGRVVDLVTRINRAIRPGITPTFFETTTALAFAYFAEEHVDVAVIEVGMGGRFDATNVVQPLGVAITHVAIDHEAYLGRTLSAIAFEKTGIIKDGHPVVIGSMPSEARAVIRQQAQDRGCGCFIDGTDFSVSRNGRDHFDYHGLHHDFEGLSCALQGVHQYRNTGCALALLEATGQFETCLTPDVVRRGLAEVVWEGRLEQIGADPLIIVDGAHNPSGAKVLADYLQERKRDHGVSRIILVVGMMRDKDAREFFRPLMPCVDCVILTEISMDRSATASALREALPIDSPPVFITAHPQQALHMAERVATPRDLICITGSLFLVGEVKCLRTQAAFLPVRG